MNWRSSIDVCVEQAISLALTSDIRACVFMGLSPRAQAMYYFSSHLGPDHLGSGVHHNQEHIR